MRRNLLSIAGLTALLFALDRLYRWLHPEVNLVRASLVGLTALIALAPLARLQRSGVRPWVGALAIYASAFLSVLLIEAGWLVSRSSSSGLVHVLILAAAFPLLDRIRSGGPTASGPRTGELIFSSEPQALLAGGVASELLRWTERTQQSLIPLARHRHSLRFALVSIELWGRLYLRGEKPDALASALLAAVGSAATSSTSKQLPPPSRGR
jgi:hypothetical protein